MRAIWHRVGGKKVGTTDNGVTREYKTRRNLLRFGLPQDGRLYELQIFRGDLLYGKPDTIIFAQAGIEIDVAARDNGGKR